MRELLLLAIGLAMPFFSYSQLNKFDLSSYKLPDILTRKLDFQFDLDGNQSRIRNNYQITPYQRNSFNLNTALNLGYSQFESSGNYQGFKDFSFDVVNNYSREKDDSDSVSTYYYFKNVFNLQNHNRWYNENNRFFELDFYLQPGITRKPDYSKVRDSENNRLFLDTYYDIWILWGKGRIDPVQDARLAIYIIEELQKVDRLIRIPEQDEIIEISKTISTIKKKRSFDHRLHKIYELKSMDSILRRMGLIKDTDIEYFTALADNWAYSVGPNRLSGRRISGGIHLRRYQDEFHIDSSNNTKLTNFYFAEMIMGPMYRCTWEKPMNLYWQRSFSLEGTLYMTSIDMLQKAIKDKGDPLGTSLSSKVEYSIGYYPNSRTSINLTSGLRFWLSDFIDIEGVFEGSSGDLDVDPSLRIRAEYYFSPELRLSINYNFFADQTWNFQNNNIDDNSISNIYNSINQNLKATFLYSIF